MHRVQKLLSNYGYCSRRNAEELIKEGRVKVNNKVISIGDKASEKDKLFVDGKPVKKQKDVYLAFNKPVGCVTALTDEYHKTIMYYIKIKERVFPIGRLDFNTSGLLLLTNDGSFANKIMHPRYEINKSYLVGLDNPISESKINQIARGVKLDDGKTSPAKVKMHNPKSIEITIHEGKNRIIRRMLKQLGIKITSLERIKIGNLSINKLSPGKYEHLTKREIGKIFEDIVQ